MESKEYNGWKITGYFPLSEDTIQHYHAEKGEQKLTIYKKNLIEGMGINSSLTKMPNEMVEWRLRYNDYDVSKARTLEKILEKADEFMLSK